MYSANYKYEQNSFLRVTFPSLLSSTYYYYYYYQVGMLSIYHMVDSYPNLFLYHQVRLQLKLRALKVETSACHVYEKGWNKSAWIGHANQICIGEGPTMWAFPHLRPPLKYEGWLCRKYIYQTLRSVVTVNQHLVGWYLVGIGLRASPPVLGMSLWIIKLNV